MFNILPASHNDVHHLYTYHRSDTFIHFHVHLKHKHPHLLPKLKKKRAIRPISPRLTQKDTWKTLQFHCGKHQGHVPPNAQSDKKSNLGVMEQREWDSSDGEMGSYIIGCGFLSHSVLFLFLMSLWLSLCLSSSMWWTVLRFGRSGPVSWLPWKLQPCKDMCILCDGS